ncbi:MAG: prolipoprotein diacylglyceryl transferase, partial [Deltaproteobacteria bacterium]|nr:prolipoprotein diacylglyceryl transferase [Deltaproteobacteria bacterium]
LLGSRLFSILLEWRELFRQPFKTVLKPGYMLHGGVAGGAAAIVGYGHFTGSPMLPLMDAWALALPVGEAVARVGCYVYGCCWGRETNSSLAVRYTSPKAKVLRFQPHLHGVKLYPAQLMGTASYLALFLMMVALLPLLPHHGMITGVYLIAHPILRVILERFRQDDRGVLFGRVTHTNLYSGIQALLGTGLLALFGATGGDVSWTLSWPVAAFADHPISIIYLMALFALTAAAFGVHLDRVGSWVSEEPQIHRHTSPSLVPIPVDKT